MLALLVFLPLVVGVTAAGIAVAGQLLSAFVGDRLSVPRETKTMGELLTGGVVGMVADAVAMVVNPLLGLDLVGDDVEMPYEVCLQFDLPQKQTIAKSFTKKNFYSAFRPKRSPSAIRFKLEKKYFDDFWEQSLPAAVAASGQPAEKAGKASKYQFQIMTCFFTDFFIRTFCGLTTMCFWSLRRKTIFIRVSAKVATLRERAHLNGFLLAFDDNLDKRCNYPAHAPYTGDDDKKDLWQRYPCGDGNCTLFRPAERLQLLHMVLNAQLDLDGVLIQRGILNAVFVLHDRGALDHLSSVWFRHLSTFRAPPINAIRDYFGAELALYTYFLTHYKFMMAPSGAVGVFMATMSAGGLAPHLQELAGLGYSFYVATWAAVYVELWKQKQKRKAVIWGTYGTDHEARDDTRPKFHGSMMQSAQIGTVVDGKWAGKNVIRYSRYKRWLIQSFSGLIVFVLVLLVIAVASSILFMKSMIKRSAKYAKLAGGFGGGANSLQIKIFDLMFEKVAHMLSEFENWPSEMVFREKLSDKLIFYKTINTFKNFAYIAFLKRYDQGCLKGCRQIVVQSKIDLSQCPKLVEFLELPEGLETPWTKEINTMWVDKGGGDLDPKEQFDLLDDYAGDCKVECALNLFIIFVVLSGTAVGVQICVPMFVTPKMMDRQRKKAAKLFETGAAKRDWMAPTELECKLPAFNLTLAYLNVVINFGYTHFFVICFPGVSCIAWFVSYATQYGDRYMMVHGTRRPMPNATETVGPWLKYMKTYARVAVFTNGGMFALNTQYPFFHENRWGGLALFIAVCLMAQIVVPFIISEYTFAIKVVRRRHESLVQSLIHGEDVLEERDAPDVPSPEAYNAENILDGPSDHVG